jgi:ATP-dependent RNA helicase DDX55/SPB4
LAGAVTNKTSSTSIHQATPSSLINYYMITPLEEKLSRLLAFLECHRQEKVIVFFLTCACVEFYGKALKQLLFSSSSSSTLSSGKSNKKNNNSKHQKDHPDITMELLHGKMVQKRRECAVERFRKCLTTIDTNSELEDEQAVEGEEEADDDENESNQKEGQTTTTTTTTTGAFCFVPM